MYSVTYASFGQVDQELYIETKVFKTLEKARSFQQDNIKCILEDNDELTDENYAKYEFEDSFYYETDSWNYITKLVEHKL